MHGGRSVQEAGSGDAVRTEAPATGIEPRWPVALTLISVVLMLHFLPERVRMAPLWMPYLVGALMLIPMAGVSLTGGAPRWQWIERRVILTLVGFSILGSLMILGRMIETLALHAAEFDGLVLFASSVAIWGTNVLYFSLIYWLIDRGGPEARHSGTTPLPDWRFPQDDAAPDVAPGWRPIFVDYLFLAFSTATAFSTTDASPLTVRAKLLMMLQSTISLLTLVVVASRAINILGN